MNYKVKTIDVFEKQAKKLVKKYASLKLELLKLVQELKENPEQGVAIGNSCYKIRVAIASKGKGKLGGARVITNFVVTEDTVFCFLFMTNLIRKFDRQRVRRTFKICA